MRTRTKALVGALAVGTLATTAVVVYQFSGGVLPGTQGCEATVGDHTVFLDPEQSENAALIAAISIRRGLPPRAATIALATAMQESKLRNIEHGDRDSLGLFQQRPSQGWGTPEQILDPVHASNAFYDALERVEDYDQLEITVAAQAVQRSAYPEGYAKHESDARALASALTGETTGGAFSCTSRGTYPDAPTGLNAQGLTKRAEVVRREVRGVFGPVPLGGFAPGGVHDGHKPGSAHYEGRAIDIFVRPISSANKQRGWAIAGYLVAQADRLQINTVIFDDKIWRAGRYSDEGWLNYAVPTGVSGDRRILEHRDHVHVDVAV